MGYFALEVLSFFFVESQHLSLLLLSEQRVAADDLVQAEAIFFKSENERADVSVLFSHFALQNPYFPTLKKEEWIETKLLIWGTGIYVAGTGYGGLFYDPLYPLPLNF